MITITILKEVISLQNSKYSRQRELLLSLLRARKDHPTADDLYMALREHMPSISLGTVYRNLSLLCESGAIQRIPSVDGADRYDGNSLNHYHFLCSDCGAVLDVDLPLQEQLDDSASLSLGAKVDGHTTLFYGRCPACMKSETH